jgi:hypothetical protein
VFVSSPSVPDVGADAEQWVAISPKPAIARPLVYRWLRVAAPRMRQIAARLALFVFTEPLASVVGAAQPGRAEIRCPLESPTQFTPRSLSLNRAEMSSKLKMRARMRAAGIHAVAG